MGVATKPINLKSSQPEIIIISSDESDEEDQGCIVGYRILRYIIHIAYLFETNKLMYLSRVKILCLPLVQHSLCRKNIFYQ